MASDKALLGTSVTNQHIQAHSTVTHVNVPVHDAYNGAVSTYLHLPRNCKHEPSSSSSPDHQSRRTAAILMSGAGGGVAGPSSMYLSIADKLSSLEHGIPVMRMDYRYPARNKLCVADTKAVMDYLEIKHGVTRVVLVGWSFGGAPVFTVGGSDPRVVGCATVASQTAETDGITALAPRPVLLLHGTADTTLHDRCSKSLYERYGPRGKRELKLFEGDDHALTKNAQAAEKRLCRFVMDCAGLKVGPKEQRHAMEQLVKPEERVELMEMAGDLKREEI